MCSSDVVWSLLHSGENWAKQGSSSYKIPRIVICIHFWITCFQLIHHKYFKCRKLSFRKRKPISTAGGIFLKLINQPYYFPINLNQVYELYSKKLYLKGVTLKKSYTFNLSNSKGVTSKELIRNFNR